MLCDWLAGRREEAGGGRRWEEAAIPVAAVNKDGRRLSRRGRAAEGGGARDGSLKQNSGSEDLDEYFTRSSLRAHVITALFSPMMLNFRTSAGADVR